MNREQLMKRIQELGFTVDDAVLYLDTHPNCPHAMAYYRVQQDLLRQARQEYQQKYGPLTVHHVQGETWAWAQQPWPWEGV